jgi:hypothetical protein
LQVGAPGLPIESVEKVWIHEGHAHQTENQTWSNQAAFSNVTFEENGIATIVAGETWDLGPWHFSCFNRTCIVCHQLAGSPDPTPEG